MAARRGQGPSWMGSASEARRESAEGMRVQEAMTCSLSQLQTHAQVHFQRVRRNSRRASAAEIAFHYERASRVAWLLNAE